MSLERFTTLPVIDYFNQRSAASLAAAKFDLSSASAEAPAYQHLLPSDLLAHARGYSPRAGSDALRTRLGELHHRPEAECLLFAGAQEALFCTMAALLKPGDEVITFTPGYSPLLLSPALFGAQTRLIPLSYDQPQADMAQLQQTVSPKTKLIIINQPHNPTGLTFSEADIAFIHQLVDEQGIYLLSDEVSIHSDFNSTQIQSLFCDHPRVITIGACSKSLGLPEIRIGWLFCNSPTLLARLISIKAYLSICCSKIDEVTLLAVLQGFEEIIRSNNRVIQENITGFEAFAAAFPKLIDWRRQKAGIVSMAKLNLSTDKMTQLVDRSLEQHHISMSTGVCFGGNHDLLRIGFGSRAFLPHLEQLKPLFSELDSKHPT